MAQLTIISCTPLSLSHIKRCHTHTSDPVGSPRTTTYSRTADTCSIFALERADTTLSSFSGSQLPRTTPMPLRPPPALTETMKVLSDHPTSSTLWSLHVLISEQTCPTPKSKNAIPASSPYVPGIGPSRNRIASYQSRCDVLTTHPS